MVYKLNQNITYATNIVNFYLIALWVIGIITSSSK